MMFRKISESLNNTLLILEKLKISSPSVTLHRDGFEIKNRMSVRLSNLPRNLGSLSSSLNIFKIMAALLGSAQALDLYYESHDCENHYKFEGEGVEIIWEAFTDFFKCGLLFDGANDSIYEPASQHWHGVDALGYKYSAQLFRRAHEDINSTIEACIKTLIENEVKDIKDKENEFQMTKILTIASGIVISATFLTSLALVTYLYRNRRGRREEMQVQDNNLNEQIIPRMA